MTIAKTKICCNDIKKVQSCGNECCRVIEYSTTDKRISGIPQLSSSSRHLDGRMDEAVALSLVYTMSLIVKKQKRDAAEAKFTQAHLWEKVPTSDQVVKRIQNWTAKISKMEMDLRHKDDNKEVSLGTSKVRAGLIFGRPTDAFSFISSETNSLVLCLLL